jgi:hypothetical protein
MLLIKTLPVLVIFSLITFSGYGQNVNDSLIQESSNIKLDSTASNLYPFRDSTLIKIAIRRLSLQRKLDSLRLEGRLTHKTQDQLDSLDKIPSLTRRFTRANGTIDNLAAFTSNTFQYLRDSLSNRSSEKLSNLDKSIRNETNVADSLSTLVNRVMPNAKLPNTDPTLVKDLKRVDSLPENFNMPTVKIPEELGSLDRKVSERLQLPTNDISKQNINVDIGRAQEGMQNIGFVPEKVEAYSNDIKKITDGSPEKVDALEGEIEKVAMNQEQLKVFNNEIAQVEASKNVLMKYHDAAAKMNEEGGKRMLIDMVGKEVPDYFAGQGEKLKNGIARLEKLKRKYGSIPDSRYLPKRAPNPMKGKSLIERIVPGINFQFFKINNLSVIDVSPFVMYRFTGRLRSGLGGTYRLNFNSKVRLDHDHNAYGCRLFADYALFNGFQAHAEGELMRMVPYNPARNINLNDSQSSKWIPGLYIGIVKNYKISKCIEGNFQVLYNFMFERNGVYQNRINIRFGFEFPLRKKTKKE